MGAAPSPYPYAYPLPLPLTLPLPLPLTLTLTLTRCGFHQGDGSDVAGLVDSLGVACLFVDFDRTLCSTKGGNPLLGHPSIDDELKSLCAQMAGRAHVVTRNQHVDEIRKATIAILTLTLALTLTTDPNPNQFLAANGLPGLPVHRVPPSRSKAAVVCDPRWLQLPAGADGDTAGPEAGPEAGGGSDCERGGGSGCAADRAPLLFVDDTLTEHLEEEMRSAPNVVRFLFTRARRTQAADAK